MYLILFLYFTHNLRSKVLLLRRNCLKFSFQKRLQTFWSEWGLTSLYWYVLYAESPWVHTDITSVPVLELTTYMNGIVVGQYVGFIMSPLKPFLQMTTRHQIVQDMFFHELVLKVKPLLDQFVEGMGTMTALVRAFPDTFEGIFLATPTTHEEVVKILKKVEVMTKKEESTWEMLVHAISDCSSEGKD